MLEFYKKQPPFSSTHVQISNKWSLISKGFVSKFSWSVWWLTTFDLLICCLMSVFTSAWYFTPKSLSHQSLYTADMQYFLIHVLKLGKYLLMLKNKSPKKSWYRTSHNNSKHPSGLFLLLIIMLETHWAARSEKGISLCYSLWKHRKIIYLITKHKETQTCKNHCNKHTHVYIYTQGTQIYS